jgi:hypothetical protein
MNPLLFVLFCALCLASQTAFASWEEGKQFPREARDSKRNENEGVLN